MTPYEPKDSQALTALTELYRDSAEPASAAELERGLNSLLARVTSGNVRFRRTVRWPMAIAAMALCIVAVLQITAVMRRHVPAPELPILTYQIDGGRVLEGGYLRESGHAGVNVKFSEGSRFTLSPGTRGRIREVGKEGARVALEHGTASFQVTPDTGRRWLVDVGPFLVMVKGTVFTVAWDPLSEQFELNLRRGRVVVSGPVSAGEIALRAGQRLAVNLAKSETLITEDNPEQATGDAAGSSVPQPAAPPDSTSSAGNDETALPSTSHTVGSSPSTRIGGERRWTDELARGQWDRILEDVKRAGLDATLNEASSEDLFAVADAARYRRQPDLARGALLAVRRRFPNSHRALDAIFLLGRVEESRTGGTAQALSRYDEYLARAPNGLFAGEALGRKMTLTEVLEGTVRARPVAEEYLRRFPKGGYAGSARVLIRVE